MRYALQAPFLTSEAVAAVSRARRWRHPLWLLGGPGTGAYEVARALHQDGDPLGFISVRQPSANAAEIESRIRSAIESAPLIDVIGVYVERVERQPLEVQEHLLRWSDEGTRWASRALPIRLFAQSDGGFRPADLLPALRHRLSSLTIPLPSLSARESDIPSIARSLGERISAELGLPEPVIDETALQALCDRDWPGNLDELAAAVTRALIATEGAPITDFDRPARPRASVPSSPAVAHDRPVSPPAPSKVTRARSDVRDLEMVIAELAHELKNPMVTIKTFADNMEQLLNDPALREKFAGLTREAIDRMDAFLEDLLKFSRYAEPRIQTVGLSQALSRALDADESRLRERVKMNGLSTKQVVRFDEQQLAFALKSLVRGVCREIPAEAVIRVELSPEGELVFHSNASGGMQQKLQSALDHESDGSAPWSLDLMMADALIRRNGGSSRIVRSRGQLQVRVTLPSPERE